METSTRFRGTADDKPLGELVQDLSRQTSTLIRQEMRLAQAELAEKGRQGEGDVVSESPAQQTPEQARLKKDEMRQQVGGNPIPLAAVAGGILALLVLLRLIRRR